MKIELLLFASMKEKVGKSKIEIEANEPCTVQSLLDTLFLQFPAIDPFAKSILVSINQEFADHAQIIHATDEVAIFPPVSGG
ncbi:MAG: molybdopterin synthase sulfur carrier subunit [Anaerolinea sp.]|nr:molybdopterin synthase sulfur carrier subunit [Anaerolinea sp.]